MQFDRAACDAETKKTSYKLTPLPSLRLIQAWGWSAGGGAAGKVSNFETDLLHL